jgi:uncharacterized protein
MCGRRDELSPVPYRRWNSARLERSRLCETYNFWVRQTELIGAERHIAEHCRSMDPFPGRILGVASQMDHAFGFDRSVRPAAACAIAVMAKASAPGRTKTRLVPPLTYDQAAALNTAFIKDVADNILRAGNQSDIAGYVAFAPTGSEDFFHGILSPTIGLIDASLPSLGECLIHTIGKIFARGHRAAVVLNADSPTLPTAFLVEAAELLAQPGEHAVFGPSSDGGYYLLGLKREHPRLFTDIAWSTERVAEQTLERAREIKLDMHLLPAWYDVDDIDDLRQLHEELRRPRASARGPDVQPHHPAATAALLRRLELGGEFARRRVAAVQAEREGA